MPQKTGTYKGLGIWSTASVREESFLLAALVLARHHVQLRSRARLAPQRDQIQIFNRLLVDNFLMCERCRVTGEEYGPINQLHTSRSSGYLLAYYM